MVAVGVGELPGSLAEVLVAPRGGRGVLLRAGNDVSLDAAGVAALGVLLHQGGHGGVHAKRAGGHVGHGLERGRDQQGHAALRAAAGDLLAGLGPVARQQDLVVKAVHDLVNRGGVKVGQGAKDQLASLALAIRQVQLVAQAPPAQVKGAREPHDAVAQQVGGEERARLAVDDGAVEIKDGDLARCHSGGLLHARPCLLRVMPRAEAQTFLSYRAAWEGVLLGGTS